MRAPLLALLLCAPAACSHGSPGGAPGAATASSSADVEGLQPNEALQARLAAAVAAKGPDYRPRTRHLVDGKPKYTNRLILSSSPYLLQHAHNPVSWFPWGDEAFELAKKLGRPVFLSIGYSTCHWCHVMEEESFEDEEIAAYLNQHYVPIKVDREERPDVDAIYLQAVELLTGRGGWPMSLWLTPERKPFFGGTYFPPRDGARGVKKGFSTILAELSETYQKDPARIADKATELTAKLQASLGAPQAVAVAETKALRLAVEAATSRFDPSWGGSKGAPKFPSSFPIRLLLRHGRRVDGAKSQEMALFTLRQMSAGGIHDQVGGGFHRYSVDARWLVPHFEKMLYDQALLALAYLEGHQASGDEGHAVVARELLDYVAREMQSPAGGYHSATDADSLGPQGEREEGYFFTWTPREIKKALRPELADTVIAQYGVTAQGNFEGRNILYTPRPESAVLAELSIDAATLKARLDEARAILRKTRNERPPPLLDDKVQASWNGLMIAAMARGSMVLKEPRYLESARRAATFLLEQLLTEGRLHHSKKGDQLGPKGYAEDYAFAAAGLLELFEAGFDPAHLRAAVTLLDALESHHGRPGGGYFRTADDAERLLTREVESRDGVIPAAASSAALAQLRLEALTGDEKWGRRAEATLKAFGEVLAAQPWAADQMLLAVDFRTDRAKEVAVILPEGGAAEDAEPLLAVARRSFRPNQVLVVARAGDEALAAVVPWLRDKPAKGGKPTAYVCEKGACDLPTTDPATFAKQLGEVVPYPAP
ncbi:MAG: thioredoxin domain-containing protein [Polyangiaceae bacterium]